MVDVFYVRKMDKESFVLGFGGTVDVIKWLQNACEYQQGQAQIRLINDLKSYSVLEGIIAA